MNNNQNFITFSFTNQPSGGLKIVRRTNIELSSIDNGKKVLQKASVNEDYFDTEYGKRIKKNAVLLNDIK